MIIRGNNIHLQNSKNNALLRSGANDNSLDNFFVQVHYLYRRKAVVLWAITGALCCLCYYYVCFTIDQSESFEEHGGMLRSLAESSSSSTKPRSRHYLIKVDKAKKQYRRAEFTMDDFPVAGVNLGKYGFAEELEVNSSAPFELFADFDISEFITGNESWSDLVNYRRELKRPSISFYGDKVAMKRWYKSKGIPNTKTFLLKYASELTKTRRKEDEKAVLSKYLLHNKDYVAKPTHKSGSSGVFIVKYDKERQKRLMGYGGDSIDDEYRKKDIAERLVEDLHKKAHDYESWALKNVKPGVMLEERFTDFKNGKYAATEFKVFTIWGRAWITNWRQGSYRPGLVHRNGTIAKWDGQHKDITSLPEYVDWGRVISIAERLGRNKDLFRTDVFVGVPADSPPLREDATLEDQRDTVQYVVSEVAFHPTSEFGSHNGIFDEGARLWLAGYKIGNYKVVPNTEVPHAFLEKGMLSEEDATNLDKA